MKTCASGLVVKALLARKKAGLTAIPVVKIRKQAAKSAVRVEDQAEKSALSIHHVVQPLRHVAKEATGVKNLRKEKKDEHKTY